MFAVTANAFAHEAFTLVSSVKKTITFEELLKIEKERTPGKKDGTTLTFTESDIRLVISTGPEDDMLSYRIQGMRNPTLVVPSDVKLRILFVNKDGDMKHDIRFAHVMAEFGLEPNTGNSAGSEKLGSHDENAAFQAEEIVLTSNADGAYKYFCSIRGHAKGGMWGHILVGVKPGKDTKAPEQMQHDHASGSDDMEDMPGMKMDDKTPAKKPDEMSDMPGMDHSNHQMQMASTTNIRDPMARESSRKPHTILWRHDARRLAAVYAFSPIKGQLAFFQNTRCYPPTDTGRS